MQTTSQAARAAESVEDNAVVATAHTQPATSRELCVALAAAESRTPQPPANESALTGTGHSCRVPRRPLPAANLTTEYGR